MFDSTPITSVTFSIAEVVQFVTVAFMAGGLVAMVRSLSIRLEKTQKYFIERTDKLEAKQSKLEDQFLKAVEELSKNVNGLTTELKTVLAVHETRITLIENPTPDRERRHV